MCKIKKGTDSMIFVKEFSGCSAWNNGLEQEIIEFLAEKKIKREDLIDIKYTFSVSAHGTGYTGALVIYEKEMP
jgi:hypothetical protein